MRKLSFVAVAICTTALVFAACGDKKFKGYQKTDSGMYYKITTKNDQGAVPKEGEFLLLTVSIDADFDTNFVIPPHDRVDFLQSSVFAGDIFEAYSLLKVGEEGEFYIKADSFFMYFMNMMPPAEVTPESLLRFKIKLNEIKSAEQYEAEMNEKLDAAKAEEKAALEQYIEEQKITVKPTESGMYFIEKQKGKGVKAESGKKITLHYTGKFLDGTVFDSSVESESGQPMVFVPGDSPMIPGFVEGVLLMREGGKATFILPSSLAYGERGAGHVIPPFTPIIFEVELLKVSANEKEDIDFISK